MFASLKELAITPIHSSISSHVVIAKDIVLIKTRIWALKLFCNLLLKWGMSKSGSPLWRVTMLARITGSFFQVM